MKKILINFAHPAKSNSRINNTLLKAIEGLDNVTINDLYAHYPDFIIDVEREQHLCAINDIIIFQHPFYWYSNPSIMNEWMELVLKHGWAYGSEQNALKGKYWMQAISTGVDNKSYQKKGSVGYTINEFLTPFKATANLCQMINLPPFMVMGANDGLSHEDINDYAQNYRRVLIALKDETIDLKKILGLTFMNDILSLLKK